MEEGDNVSTQVVTKIDERDRGEKSRKISR